MPSAFTGSARQRHQRPARTRLGSVCLDRDRRAQHVVAPAPPHSRLFSGGSTCHVTDWRSVRGLASGTVARWRAHLSAWRRAQVSAAARACAAGSGSLSLVFAERLAGEGARRAGNATLRSRIVSQPLGRRTRVVILKEGSHDPAEKLLVCYYSDASTRLYPKSDSTAGYSIGSRRPDNSPSAGLWAHAQPPPPALRH